VWSAVGAHDGVHDVVRVIREASPGARPEQVRGNSKGKVAALETRFLVVILPNLHRWLGIVFIHVMLLGIQIIKLNFSSKWVKVMLPYKVGEGCL
jgi:hypothetical protein